MLLSFSFFFPSDYYNKKHFSHLVVNFRTVIISMYMKFFCHFSHQLKNSNLNNHSLIFLTSIALVLWYLSHSIAV